MCATKAPAEPWATLPVPVRDGTAWREEARSKRRRAPGPVSTPESALDSSNDGSPHAVHMPVSLHLLAAAVSGPALPRSLTGALAGAGLLLASAGPAFAQSAESAVDPPEAPLGGSAPLMLSAPPVQAVDAQEAAGSSDAPREDRQFGAMLDLGVPDGTMISFVYRPIRMARLHAGAGYNGISPGLRLGGVFLPFGAGPSLSLDYGHYFEGDANGVVNLFSDTREGRVLLESVGYDYVSLRAGVDLGGDRFTFFARGGISWLRTAIREFDTLLAPSDQAQSQGTSISVPEDPVLNLFVPTFQLGFIVHL